MCRASLGHFARDAITWVSPHHGVPHVIWKPSPPCRDQDPRGHGCHRAPGHLAKCVAYLPFALVLPKAPPLGTDVCMQAGQRLVPFSDRELTPVLQCPGLDHPPSPSPPHPWWAVANWFTQKRGTETKQNHASFLEINPRALTSAASHPNQCPQDGTPVGYLSVGRK